MSNNNLVSNTIADNLEITTRIKLESLKLNQDKAKKSKRSIY